jgi:hypothetical protein
MVIGVARADNVDSVQSFHVSFCLAIAAAALVLYLSAALPRPTGAVTVTADFGLHEEANGD